MITLDSNSLKDNWREEIEKSNHDTSYHWERLNDEMRSHEDEDGDEDDQDDVVEQAAEEIHQHENDDVTEETESSSDKIDVENLPIGRNF